MDAQVATTSRAPSIARSKSRFEFKSDTLAHRLNALINDPPLKRFYWWDSSRTGFGFRVNPDLTGVYVYRYRNGGKQRVLTLGKFEKFNDAKSAWKSAVGAVEEARRGIAEGRKVPDPIDRKRENRQRHAELGRTSKVSDVVDRFLAARQKDTELRDAGKATARPGLRDSTAKQYAQMFKLDLVKLLGDRPIGTLTKDDIRRACNRAKDRDAAATAARLLAAISSLFTWANHNNIVEGNPARSIDEADYYTGTARTRTLTDSEIKAIFTFAGAKPSTVWLGLLLTLATGQRSGELLKLRTRDVDGDAIVIPAEVTKNGVAHRVPLSPIATEFVDELRLRAGKSQWLFPGKDPREAMEQQTLGVSLRRAQKASALTTAFRPHDLRRTCRTHLSVLGVPEYIGELILGHELRNAVERHYSHHAFEQEQRLALEKWSAKLCELRGAPAKVSNVVALPMVAKA